MNGAATLTVASSFGTTICHRGIGARVRFASVRSSTSLPKATVAIARTTRGVIEPASIVLRTMSSNSSTDAPLGTSTRLSVRTMGINASTDMTSSRHRPESWLSVSR